MKRIVRDYGLGLVLFALFAVSWVAQTWFGWQEFVAEQREHGQAAQVYGPEGYAWSWARTTFENWQSEFLQLLAMVALTSFLLFKGSPESKDGDDEMKATLARLERRLDELARADTLRNGRSPTQDLSSVRAGATGGSGLSSILVRAGVGSPHEPGLQPASTPRDAGSEAFKRRS